MYACLLRQLELISTNHPGLDVAAQSEGKHGNSWRYGERFRCDAPNG
jgi:hypothetical protein